MRRDLSTHTAATIAATCIVGALAAVSGSAQAPAAGLLGPTSGRAVAHDVSPPLRRLAEAPRAPFAGESLEMPLLRRQRTYPPNLPGGEDPLRQIDDRPFPNAAPTPAPTSSFEGINNIDGVLPPDTNGDVGPSHYVQWVNLSFAVFDKATGAIVPGGGPFDGSDIWDGFGGPCESTNDGDPIALYDHLADRWLMSQFAISSGIQCVALSTTGDPLGAYHRWAFVVSPGQQNDYPKIGLMPDAYYLTTRDFPYNSGNFAGFTAFDREAMLAGDSSPTFVKYGLTCNLVDNNCPDGVQPPHLEGPPPPGGTPGYFTKTWDDDYEGPWSGASGDDGYRIWEFVPDFENPGSSTFSELPMIVAGADFDTNLCGGNRACIEQPPVNIGRCLTHGIGCPALDGFADLQMYRAQFRHWASFDSLVLSNGVDADGNDTSGVRWAELRNTGPGGSWEVHQDGTYAPDDGAIDHSRWMSSIAMDADGNIALGYSVSSTTVFPSIRYTTREASDPLGTMPGGEVELMAGSGTQTSSSSRWGDYSSMSVDPMDDCTFWYTQEYIQTTGSAPWRTRIGSFKIPGCTAPGISTPGLLDAGPVEVGATGAPLLLTIQNLDNDPIDITGIILSNTTDFSLDASPPSDPCGGTLLTLGAGDSCNVEITFTPQSQAVFDETLEISTAAWNVSASASQQGVGYFPCPHNASETLTGSESGAVIVDACETVTIGPYDFTGGTLTVTAGEAIEVLGDSSFADDVELAVDPFLALP